MKPQEPNTPLPMAVVQLFPHAAPQERPKRSSEVQAGKVVLAPLLGHLKTIADQKHVEDVITLLRDIRDYQDHPEMVRAFEENQHTLAHAVKDHENDILELIVRDYIEHHNLTSDEKITDTHKMELELHIQHVILGALKDYQEVVENIREDVSGLAERLKEDDSIAHIRELITHLKNSASDEAVHEGIADMPVGDSMRHLFYYEDSDDLHQALAKVAYQEGLRDKEAVSRFVGEDLYERLGNHFAETIPVPKLRKSSSGTHEIKAGLVEIRQARESNRRVNASLSLMESLRTHASKEGDELIKKHLNEKEGFTAYLLGILQDSSKANIEEMAVDGSYHIAPDCAELAHRVEDLVQVYLHARGTADPKIPAGLRKLSHAKANIQLIHREATQTIPPHCQELWTVLDNEADLVQSITALWLQNDHGNVEYLDRLLGQLTADAQSYLDPEVLKTPIPPAPKERAAREKLIGKLQHAAFETPAYTLCRLLTSASANYQKYPPLQALVLKDVGLHQMLTRFTKGDQVDYEAIVEIYFERKVQDPKLGFDQHIDTLLASLQNHFDEDLCQFLLHWNRRLTIPVSVAPPSEAPETIKIPPLPSLSAKKVTIRERQQIPSVYTDESHTVPAGLQTEIAYAMNGSTIEIEDGGVLDLYMAGNRVTLKLGGPEAGVTIKKAGRNCQYILILDENGSPLTREMLNEKPNLCLGEGVAEKLFPKPEFPAVS